MRTNPAAGTAQAVTSRPPSVRPRIWLCGPELNGFAAGVETEAQLLQQAREAGIDLDLIESNLALSVPERWRQHDGALRFILKLQQAKAAYDAGLQPTDR